MRTGSAPVPSRKSRVPKWRRFRARHYWYDADMNLAQQAMETSKGLRLLGYLERQQPQPGQEDLRGFDWYYLWWLSHPDRVALEGHTQPVTCVAYSADGRFLATGSGDASFFLKPGEVKLWDPAKNVLLRNIGSFPHGVSALAFSPDGTILATGTSLPRVRYGTRHRSSCGTQLPAERYTRSRVSPYLSLPWFSLPMAKRWWWPQKAGIGKGITEEERKRGIMNAGVKLWDLATSGEKPMVLKTKGAMFVARSLALSADGKTLAAAGITTPLPAWDRDRPVPPADALTMNRAIDGCRVRLELGFREGAATIPVPGLDQCRRVLARWTGFGGRMPG